MNKQKVKNIILVVSIAFNLLGSLILGGALIHSCSNPPSPANAPLSASSVEIGQLRAPSPKKASTGVFRTDYLDVPEDADLLNGVDPATSFSLGIYFGTGDVTLNKTTNKPWQRTYHLHLQPEETYYFKGTYGDGQSGVQGTLIMGTSSLGDVFENMVSSVASNIVQSVTPSESNPVSGRPIYGESFFFKAPSYATDMLLYYVSPNLVQVALASALDIPPSEVITFPTDYNPLTAFGYASDGLIGQLAGSASSPFALDLAFVSGGHFFKRIDFYFLPMQGVEYLPTGSDHSSVFQPTDYVYPALINYVDVDGVNFPAWRAVWGITSNGNHYLKNYGEWLSQDYQRIGILTYTPATGISGLAPSLDQVGLLKLRTSYGVPPNVIGGGGYADVFTLLGSAFTSLAPILSVQVLPFLTIGTLLLVPLVVLIIFAILKVLNK